MDRPEGRRDFLFMRIRPQGIAALALATVVIPSITRSQSRPQEVQAVAVDSADFDRTVRPQDDFERFVNGRWIDTFDLAGRARYEMFTELAERARRDRLALIEQIAARPTATVGSPDQLIRDLYRSFLDSATIERRGVAPLAEDLAAIDSIRSRQDLVRYMGASQSIDFYARPFAVYIRTDRQDPNRSIAYVEPGRLLRERDVYLEPSKQWIRDAYAAHIERLYALAGWSRGREVARVVLGLETRLARAMWAPERARDRVATYNRYSAEKANALASHLDWNALFAAAGMHADEFILTQPSYFPSLDSALVEVPLGDWKDYFRYQVLSWRAELLPQAIAQEDLDFSNTLAGHTGSTAPFVRRTRAAPGIGFMLSNALERAYVQRYYHREAGMRAAEVVENLRAAFGAVLDSVDWMSPTTKAEARRKLQGLRARIGYGTDTVDYSGLTMRPDDLLGNVRRYERWALRRSAAQLLRPVDRTKFPGSAHLPAESYLESTNEFVLTAAVMQPPLLDLQADPATTYGMLGSLIGHEMSHAFDNRGRRSDADGAMRDWWTPEDDTRFNARTARLISQYDAFVAIDSTHVNGRLTVNENIADLLGVRIAYRAYKRSLKGKQDVIVNGLTGDQRFFIGFARWFGRGKVTDEALRQQLASQPHAPYQFRVNGVLMNVPEFYAAFAVKKGDRMYRPPEERVAIW